MKSGLKDLTSGTIVPQLFRLAVPIIGTSFMQMTYSLADMLWLGRLGEESVASVGVAGFYVWFGISLLLVTRVGAEVGVSQAVGNKNYTLALRFIRHSLFWAVLLSIFFAILVWFFAPSLILFFGVESVLVNTQATGYLRIVALSFVFFFVNPTFSGIYNGMGNSKSPFWYMTAGVVLNIILDPLLIFGYGIIPAMGVEGAAWATFLSQMLVFIIFVYRFIIQKEMIELHLSKFRFDGAISKRIFSLGLPVASESAAFAFFAMILAKMLAMFGPVAIAVQSIGAQIEALSWMTSSGFATALGSFTGQNFGASNWNRIKTGFQFTIIIGSALGIMVTGVFLFFGSSIFSLFLSDVESQQLGGIYLSILAVSQVFMIYEITTRGAFNGIGKTIPPSVIGIIFTGLRIPIAYMLISFTSLGLLGIWWAISATSVIKGIVLPLWFVYVLSRKSKGLTEVIGKNVITILSSRLRQQSVIKRIKR